MECWHMNYVDIDWPVYRHCLSCKQILTLDIKEREWI